MRGMICLLWLRQLTFDKLVVVVYNRIMVKKQILNTIKEHNLFKKGVHIVLGLSGGPDSVCLFDVLCKEAEVQQWQLYPVHVNHKFRPGAAEEDQAYVEKLCQQRGWPCASFVYDCNKIAEEEKLTSEEAGRKVRYEAFANRAKKLADNGIEKEDIVIAVAQNADDQAETILFRMLRGAGTDGLAGIGYSREDEAGFRIVRPLLDCHKKDIVSYCESQELEPRIDHTNLETVYMRNKIRLELIPFLQAYNPNITDTMIRMGKGCAADKEFLWETALEAFENLCREKGEKHLLLDGPGLRDLHKSIRQRVIARALAEIGLAEDLTYGHFAMCEEIIFHEHPSASANLPKGYCLAKNYDHIKVFLPDEEVSGGRLKITILSAEEYAMLELDKSVHASFDAEQMEAAYGPDYAERIVLGRREAGDTIAMDGGKRKKVQDYFVDRKIPKDQRDKIGIVKIAHDVLWVLPYQGRGRFCSKFKLCPDTKNVICIEIICDL